MSDNWRPDVERTLPRLREQCKSSHALTVQAIERARRAADAARAIRMLLQSRADWREGPAPDAWRAAAGEVARVGRERDRVFGILSHELRQALNAALSAEQLLAISTDARATARARGVLRRQLLHMSRLVEDLLDFSRLSLEARTIERRPLDFRDVVAQAIETIEAGIAEQGLHLSVTQPLHPQMVMADSTRLRQVVSNLLHNAMRYTPRGGSISVAVIGDTDKVLLEVRDSGEGIDPTHLPSIFEPFKRQSEKGPGLGVGLALAKRLVEVHGGTVAAHSDGPGRGSVFTVRLPIAQGS